MGEWLQIAVVTSTVIIGVEMDKWIRNKRRTIPQNPALD
jgi:hypothetical protein